MSCHTCCQDISKLCIDASFFVPSDVDTCYAINMNFLNAAADNKPASICESFSSNLSEHNVDIQWFRSSKVNGNDIHNKIAKLKLTSEFINNSYTIIPSIEGYTIYNSIHTSTNAADKAPILLSEGGTKVRSVNFSTLRLDYAEYGKKLDETSAIGNSELSENYILYSLIYGNKIIGKISFATKINADVDGNLNTNVFIWYNTNEFYDNGSGNNTFVSEHLISLMHTNGEELDKLTWPMAISSSSLVLQLRSNANFINGNPKSDDNPDLNDESFSSVIYDVCVNYKKSDGTFDNLSIIKILVENNSISAKWGKNTDKNDKVLNDLRDTALLLPAKLKISVCGNISSVYDNTNDFVIYINNVMQSFDLIGPSKLIHVEDALENMQISTINKPYPVGVISFNENHEDYPLRHVILSNSKLYISIRYICFINKKSDNNTKIVNCPHNGTLNPYNNISERSGSIKIKGFCMQEITNMNDHPLHGSKLSANTTCCLGGNFVDNIQ